MDGYDQKPGTVILCKFRVRPLLEFFLHDINEAVGELFIGADYELPINRFVLLPGGCIRHDVLREFRVQKGGRHLYPSSTSAGTNDRFRWIRFSYNHIVSSVRTI